MPVSAREVVMIGRYGRLGLFLHPGRHDWQLVDEALEMVGMDHRRRLSATFPAVNNASLLPAA
jgi:ABC-type Mn2+/Zn2+ transport system ATPase subunit